MSPLRTVAAPPGIEVSASGPLTHRCPVADETDIGTVEIWWTTVDASLELHSLAAYLADWAETAISHEELSAAIRETLTAVRGINDVVVIAQFETAGLTVSAVAPSDAENP